MGGKKGKKTVFPQRKPPGKSLHLPTERKPGGRTAVTAVGFAFSPLYLAATDPMCCR